MIIMIRRRRGRGGLVAGMRWEGETKLYPMMLLSNQKIICPRSPLVPQVAMPASSGVD